MIAGLVARLVSPLVAIPLMLALASGLVGFGFVKGFGMGKDRSEIVWRRSLDEANRVHENELQEALDEAEKLEATPTTDAELVSLCARDPACRDRKG
jgi:hypothetical protein